MVEIQCAAGAVQHDKLGVTLAHEHLVLASPGLPEQYPWLYDRDALGPEHQRRIRAGEVLFLWCAPPCSSFAAIRNINRHGPLRPPGRPYGDPHHPEYRVCILGNRLWRDTPETR